jgi:hypothetical protein
MCGRFVGFGGLEEVNDIFLKSYKILVPIEADKAFSSGVRYLILSNGILINASRGAQ